MPRVWRTGGTRIQLVPGLQRKEDSTVTWFKIDDGFYDHPKVLGLDMSAIGLWAMAGAYCARHLTDGVIDDRQIRSIGGTRRQAEKLVASGLWSADDAPPSARRYSFNDWRDFQPSRADVQAKREEARQRVAAARAKKRSTSEVPEMFARTDDERSRTVRSTPMFAERSHYPDPTRPDPTITSTHLEESSHVSNASASEEQRPTGPAIDVDGWKLVRDIIPANHPQATKTALALEAATLLRSGTPENDITAALGLWLTKPNLGPRTLPSLVSEVIRSRDRPTTPAFSRPGAAISTADQRVAQAQALKNTPGTGWPGGPLELT